MQIPWSGVSGLQRLTIQLQALWNENIRVRVRTTAGSALLLGMVPLRPRIGRDRDWSGRPRRRTSIVRAPVSGKGALDRSPDVPLI